MKTMKKKFLTLALCASLFASCDKKNTPPTPTNEDNKFVHSVLVGGQNTYLSLFKDLEVGKQM